MRNFLSIHLHSLVSQVIVTVAILIGSKTQATWCQEKPLCTFWMSSSLSREARGKGVLLTPYFFDINVNGANYPKMFKQFIVPFSFTRYSVTSLVTNSLWTRRGNPTLEPKRAIFPGGWIARGSNSVSQPAHCPDFSPNDFLVGERSKMKITKTSIPEYLEIWKKKMETVFNKIDTYRVFQKSLPLRKLDFFFQIKISPTFRRLTKI